jgi:hypothetical protein
LGLRHEHIHHHSSVRSGRLRFRQQRFDHLPGSINGPGPDGIWDNVVFNNTMPNPTTLGNQTIDLQGLSTLTLNEIRFTGTPANFARFDLNNTVGAMDLTLNGVVVSGTVNNNGGNNGSRQINANVRITAAVNPLTNPSGNFYVTTTSASQLQLQSQITASGDVIKNGTGAVRFGTRGTNFTSAISGNIVVNNGSIEGATNNLGNPVGGTGRAVVLNGPGVALNLRSQANFDFEREIDLRNHATISADRSVGTAPTNQLITTGAINVLANNKYLFVNSANDFDFGFDGINLGTNTLNMRNGLNGTGVATLGVLTGSGKINIAGAGGKSNVGMSFNAASPAFSGSVNIFEGGGHTILATGALGSGTMTLGTSGNNLPITFPNPAIGAEVPPVRNNPWSGRLTYAANNATTAAIAVRINAASQVDMSVVPNAGDVIQVNPIGIVQGDSTELAGFTAGTNLLVSSNAIIAHKQIGGSEPAGLGTTPAHYSGLAATLDGAVTIGAGTPWKGISNDRSARSLGGGTTVINVNGGNNNSNTIEATLLGVHGQTLSIFWWRRDSGVPKRPAGDT